MKKSTKNKMLFALMEICLFVIFYLMVILKYGNFSNLRFAIFGFDSPVLVLQTLGSDFRLSFIYQNTNFDWIKDNNKTTVIGYLVGMTPDGSLYAPKHNYSISEVNNITFQFFQKYGFKRNFATERFTKTQSDKGYAFERGNIKCIVFLGQDAPDDAFFCGTLSN
jgi:hypothetical protein